MSQFWPLTVSSDDHYSDDAISGEILIIIEITYENKISIQS